MGRFVSACPECGRIFLQFIMDAGGNTPSAQGGTTWQHTSGTEDVVASDGESDYPDDFSAVQGMNKYYMKFQRLLSY